jgi:cytochrome P450
MASIWHLVPLNSRTLLQAVLLAVAVTALGHGYLTHARRRRMQKEHGCLPLAKNKWVPQTFWIPGVGIQAIQRHLKTAREGTLLATQLDRYKTFGETFKNRMLFDDFIITADPQNVKAMLATQFKDFGLASIRAPYFQALMGQGIFTTDGGKLTGTRSPVLSLMVDTFPERWHRSRSMIRPNFIREQIADLEAFERHLQIMLALIPRDGTTVDLQPLFFAFTIDSATEFLFGRSVDALQEMKTDASPTSTSNSFAKAFDYAQASGMVRFRLRSLHRFYRDRKDDESIKFCHEYLKPFIESALRKRQEGEGLTKKEAEQDEGRKKYVFAEELAMQTDDPVVIRDELINILLAGRDTTASLMGNMFFMLARRPDIFAKLKAEIDTLDGKPPTYETLRNLKYLKYCINECKKAPVAALSPSPGPLTY